MTSGSLSSGSGTSGGLENGDTGSPAAGNSNSGVSLGICSPQSTVTVTTQYTVTVTQIAAVATTAGSASPLQNGSTANGPGSPAQNGSYNGSNGSGSSLENGVSASGSAGPKCTTCSKANAYGTVAASASTGMGSLYGNGTRQGSKYSAAANASSLPGPGTSNNSSILSAQANTTETTNGTSDANLRGEFWAGGTITTLMRMEAIPGRLFYDYDGVTVKDPIKTLADSGLNAIRVETFRDNGLGPTVFKNNASTRGEELLFKLDWGGIDIAVKTAQRAAALGMRLQLTINQGFTIPKDLESLDYDGMVGAVQDEAKRQLQPFLDANIVPDIILFENEGSDGFLFTEESTGHTRGTHDGKASAAKVDQELCGKIPTGNMASYPQYAGYLKAEVIACNEAITASGFSTAKTRYGLHSHGQYVQWKEACVHGPNPLSQTELKDSSGATCSNSVIPQNILSQNASEMLTIMGFSAYPDPMTPADINSESSMADSLTRLTKTLTQMQGYAEAYGKYTDGEWAGQWKLQGLGVEYGTTFTYDQIAQEQSLTELMWKTVKQFSVFMGNLWYEPWYCYSDWEGGKAALCHTLDGNAEAPTNTMKTWGAAAVSPWKK